MAYKFQMTDAILSGGLSPQTDNSFDLGVEGAEWKDLRFDGTAYAGAYSGSSTLYAAGAATFSSTVAASGSITAGSSFIIGSADLNETDMEKLDGITDGTGAANKALVLDASRDVDNINALGIASMANNWTNAGRTVADLGVVTTVDINGGSMDGVTIGAASAAAATVSSLSVSDGNITNVGDIALDTISADNGSSFSFGDDWTNAGNTVADLGTVTTADINGGTLDGVAIGASSQSTAKFTTVSASSTLEAVGAARFSSTLYVSGALSGAVGVTGASFDADGAITAGTSFIIGSADLNEADMEKLDGITDGTGAANKALVLDASRDVDNINALGIASMANNWTNAGRTVADMGILTTVDINGGTADGVVIGASSAAAGTFTTLVAGGDVDLGDATSDTITATGRFDSDLVPSSDSARDLGTSALQWAELHCDAGYIDAITVTGTSALAVVTATSLSASSTLEAVGNSFLGGNLAVSGTVELAGVADAAATLASDSFYFLDGDGLMKSESMVDYASSAAGNGLSAAQGVFALDLNELAASTVDVAADSIAIVDADDSNASKKESIADLVAAMAGPGLTATNGVLSSDASPTPTNHGDANGTLAEGMNFSSADFSAARTWTLPASPDAGDVVTVKAPANAAAYELTIARAGSQTIDGETSVVLMSDNGAIEFVYLGSDKWAIK